MTPKTIDVDAVQAALIDIVALTRLGEMYADDLLDCRPECEPFDIVWKTIRQKAQEATGIIEGEEIQHDHY